MTAYVHDRDLAETERSLYPYLLEYQDGPRHMKLWFRDREARTYFWMLVGPFVRQAS